MMDVSERRLSYQQRAFAGNRCSDHIAMLNAFQTWEDVRQNGPNAEENFCEHKQLSVPTLRVTWEAKVSHRWNQGYYSESLQDLVS